MSKQTQVSSAKELVATDLPEVKHSQMASALEDSGQPDRLSDRMEQPAGPLADKNSSKPVLWILCGALSFTLMGGMTNALGQRCDWRLVAQSRTILSFLVALGLARLAGAKLVFRRPRILWLRSLSGTLSLMSTFYALTHLPVADVLTLTNTYPLWIVVIGFVLWGESVESSVVAAIISAIIGVILIQQPHLEGNSTALASALAAACFTAVAMMGLNRLGAVDPRSVVVHFSGVAALIMIPVLTMGHPVDWSVLRDRLTLTLLLGVGITGTIGQIFLTKAYAAAGSAPKIAVIGMSQVAMGLVFDIGFRQKLPPALSLLGMMFVIGPVVWLISQGKARPKTVPPTSKPETELSESGHTSATNTSPDEIPVSAHAAGSAVSLS